MRRGIAFRTELLGAEAEDAADAHGRWIISYADFITLMFAFFVVMYSISSVNDGKFRVLSQTMLSVFSNPDVAAAVEAQVRARSGGGAAITTTAIDDLETAALLGDLQTLSPGGLEGVLQALFRQSLEEGRMAVRQSSSWTEIELPADATFADSEGALNPAAVAALADIAELAAVLDVPVRVEGFSDNVPSGADGARSSIAQSALHAAGIAAALVSGGVRPEQISATGLGEQFPVASNASAAGRAQNRRVVIAIARDRDATGAAVSLAAQPEQPERLPERTLSRISTLPGPAPITL